MKKIKKNLLRIAGLALTSGALIIFSQCTIIRPGYHGVINRPFGKGIKTDKVYNDGFIWKSPFSNMFKYNTKWQSYSEGISILTKDELHTTLNFSIILRPIESELPYLILEVGPYYYKNIVKPIFYSVSRGVIADYNYSDLSSKSAEIEKEIHADLVEDLKAKHIEIDRVTLDHIEYSLIVTQATDKKLATKQLLEQKEYEVEIAKKESEILVVDAKGQRDAQKIIDEGLTSRYLQYKALDVQEKAANSTNAKFYFIPLGENGLPIIIDSK